MLSGKGAGSGFAEVDFRAVDGRRLRARWEVRRAREKADGRLQAQWTKAEEPAALDVRADRIDELLSTLEADPYVLVVRPGQKIDAVHGVRGVVPQDGPWGDYWNIDEWRVE